MFSAKPTLRSSLPRAVRSTRVPRSQFQKRFESTSSASASKAGSGHVVAGLTGGLVAGAVIYGAWYMTPSGRISAKVNKYAVEAQSKYNEAAQKLQENTPDSSKAMDYIRDFAYSYVAWIPGGRQYVDMAFKDIDKVRENNKEEVDKLASQAYKEMQELSKSGLSLETANKAFEALSRLSQQAAELAGGAFKDIVENHPELKENVGGSLDQLQQMGDSLGPEAKKQVQETFDQIKDIMKGGFSAASIYKVQQLVKEKSDKLKQFGDEAWKKGMEQAKPYLEKNPKVKELVEKNASSLKSGNVTELSSQVKSAVESGKSEDLEKYVNQAVDKAKSKTSGMSVPGLGNLEQYFKMIPSGGEILPKIQNLKDVAEKHAGEGEKLLKETMDELKAVLQKQSKKAEDIVNKASKEAK